MRRIKAQADECVFDLEFGLVHNEGGLGGGKGLGSELEAISVVADAGNVLCQEGNVHHGEIAREVVFRSFHLEGDGCAGAVDNGNILSQMLFEINLASARQGSTLPTTGIKDHH